MKKKDIPYGRINEWRRLIAFPNDKVERKSKIIPTKKGGINEIQD